MKATYLIVGLLVGATVSFFLTKSFVTPSAQNELTHTEPVEQDTLSAPSPWNWPETLDAVKAAPDGHQIVYEDDSVRILKVILEPNQVEPVHTHQWKSIMWFTKATPMTYYSYDQTHEDLVVKDSFAIPQMPPEVLDHGDAVDAEGPHAVKNSGDADGIAYRVEFKQAL
ncbi:hypothetical protein [Flagellimonas amoyensis]|uniref:hypothetical protein n=1 Tax=Flagellimonas amoyensis TaxID=2169401 RepID=UPI00131F37D7|nr:hypothetical protein [Allomuricauda amoyensis]